MTAEKERPKKTWWECKECGEPIGIKDGIVRWCLCCKDDNDFYDRIVAADIKAATR